MFCHASRCQMLQLGKAVSHSTQVCMVSHICSMYQPLGAVFKAGQWTNTFISCLFMIIIVCAHHPSTPLSILEIEPRILSMLDTCSTTDCCLSPKCHLPQPLLFSCNPSCGFWQMSLSVADVYSVLRKEKETPRGRICSGIIA